MRQVFDLGLLTVALGLTLAHAIWSRLPMKELILTWLIGIALGAITARLFITFFR